MAVVANALTLDSYSSSGNSVLGSETGHNITHITHESDGAGAIITWDILYGDSNRVQIPDISVAHSTRDPRHLNVLNYISFRVYKQRVWLWRGNTSIIEPREL